MRVSFSDAVNLRSSLSGAQKEKDGTKKAKERIIDNRHGHREGNRSA
ncbi:hypothetical protein [Photorhabdus namnaonensis]|nr:hypothetical protein [Photorhabdus namnaonensis]